MPRPTPPSRVRARVGARRRARLAPGLLPAVALLAACGGPGRVVVYEPPLNAQEVALRVETTEHLEVPLSVVFEWAMVEQGTRVSGRGVARMEPPYKARLDLFLGNGEPAGVAALVDDDLRLPTSLPPSVLPPANLLWSTLGVFRPGLGTALLGAERASGRVDLRYGLPGGEEAVYHLRDGRIEEVEVFRQGTVVHRLTIERDALQVPVQAVYRDLVSVRELRLTRESVSQTEPFPPDIWWP